MTIELTAPSPTVDAPLPATLSEQLSRIAKLATPLLGQVKTGLFFASIGCALALGWMLRDEELVSAENGLGYGLGVVGGVLMLLLTLYPLRKRWKPLHRCGPVRWWFRAHMLCGVFGPLAILYHCNFQPGSLNSNIALACMLLVAGSGLLGRYLYSRLHYGLYGRRATLASLIQDTELTRTLLLPCPTPSAETLKSLEGTAVMQPHGLCQGAVTVLRLAVATRSQQTPLRAQLHRALAELAKQQAWTADELGRRQAKASVDLASHLTLLRKIGHLSFYERIFSLWHLMHLPLFLMLVISGVVHVVAVHLY
jgi:hypothetical protein